MKYSKTNFRLLVFLSLCVIVTLFFAISITFDLQESGIFALLIATVGIGSGEYYYFKSLFIKNGADMSSKPQDLMEHKPATFSESEEFPIQRLYTNNLVIFIDDITYEFQRKDALGNFWFKDHFAPFSKSFSITPQELKERAVQLVGPKGIKWQKAGYQRPSLS